MPTLQVFLEVLVSAIIGLAFSGVYMTGSALCARYFTMNEPPTAYAHVAIPRFTRPSSLPVQLQYSPLTTDMNNEPLALVGFYDLASIALDYPHHPKPLPPRPPPQPRLEQPEQPKQSEQQQQPERSEQPEQANNDQPLASSTPFTNLFAQLVQALRAGFTLRPVTIALGLAIASIVLLLYSKKIIVDVYDLQINRRTDDIHSEADVESLRLEADYLARTTRQLTTGLERCTRERNALYRAAAQRDHYQRVATNFERIAMRAVEDLAVLDEDNDLWDYLLEHGIVLPESVITGDQTGELPNTGVHVPVDPSRSQ